MSNIIKDQLNILKKQNMTTIQEDIEFIKILFNNNYIYDALLYIKQCRMQDMCLSLPITDTQIISDMNLDTNKLIITIVNDDTPILRYSISSSGYVARVLDNIQPIKGVQIAKVIKQVASFTKDNPDAFEKLVAKTLDHMIANQQKKLNQ